MKIVRIVRWIRRLIRERSDARAHNQYLIRVNTHLTKLHSKAAMREQTLRWHIHDLERALYNVGTENE